MKPIRRGGSHVYRKTETLHADAVGIERYGAK
jgi:hypothetical protein